MLWKNENYNNDKPVCKKGYVYKCLATDFFEPIVIGLGFNI